jgi:hypothetical protein
MCVINERGRTHDAPSGSWKGAVGGGGKYGTWLAASAVPFATGIVYVGECPLTGRAMLVLTLSPVLAGG